MKKSVLLILLAILAFNSCSSDEPADLPEKKDVMVGTKWEAKDEIATLIWGETISRLEFLESNKFQDIAITKGSVRGVDEGTYAYLDGNLTLNYPKYFSDGRGRTIKCVVKGGIMTTNQGNPSGGYMTYQKK